MTEGGCYETNPLTQDREAIVDAKDYNHLIQWKWHTQCVRCGKLFYACRTEYNDDGEKRTIFMHQVVAEFAKFSKGRYDHVNGNGLDNRRRNLRLASGCQNQQNRGPNSNNTSGFKGVHFESSTGKYRAEIMAFGKRRRLGRFLTPNEAAQAYNDAATNLHREFACLNTIPSG